MNGVQCTIPADLLRLAAAGLYELAIRKRMAAGKLPAVDGKINPQEAELLKQAAESQKAADFYLELYQQRPVESEAERV